MVGANIIAHPSATASCKRFIPQSERSVICRYCSGPFFQHTPTARRFDSVLEMYRAYMTDAQVLKWLFEQSNNLNGQINILEDILLRDKEVPGAPDNVTINAVLSCLKQISIERVVAANDVDRCTYCKRPLIEKEEAICSKCLEMAAEDASAAAGDVEVQDIRAAGTDAAESITGS